MVSFSAYLLPLAVLCHWVVALPPIVQMHPNLKVGNLASIFDYTDAYPMPNAGNVTSHDPNILEHKNAFYMFKGGVHIPIFKATDMSGPWKQIGTVLDKPSIIPDRENATRPWAPTTVEYKGKFYCFYSVSQAGSRHSGIGVASTDDVEKGSWTDHGTLVLTGEKNEGSPYNVTNAIDPSFVVDHKTGAPYLNYGSYWHNLWQVPLEDDLLSVKGDTTVHVEAAHKTKNEQKNQDKNDKSEKNDNDDSKDKDNKKNGPKKNQHNKRDESGNKQQDNSDDQDKKQTKPVENLHATQLTYMPNAKDKPQEGSWMSFHDGYYYLWFSHGKCCDFENRFPKKGQEYSIRVGRSENVSGPFKDKEGTDLRQGGGTIIYGSNHGLTYAPGGLGVLPGNNNRRDILYYHYLDTRIGFKHKQAQLGWNYLDYNDGWPVASKNNGKDDKKDTKKTKTENKDKDSSKSKTKDSSKSKTSR